MINKKVLELLTQTRNPYEVARKMDSMRPQDVRLFMLNHPQEELHGWGRVNLQPYILSRRRSFAPSWPTEDLPVILEHRRMHDQGKVTMCQGRSGEWIIQYAIPLRRPIKREPYFYGADR